MQADGTCEPPFDAIQEMAAVEQEISQIGDRAVAPVFGIGVMHGMMLRRLHEVNALQEGNDVPVFRARTMRPFVDFIRVGTDGSE